MKVNRLRRVAGEAFQEGGALLSRDELADRAQVPAAEVAQLLQLEDAVSMNAPIGAGEKTLEDFLADESALAPFDNALNEELAARLECALAKLDEREAYVLRAHYGIGTSDRTLLDLGQELGVSRERVRQIEANALERLRHPNSAAQLMGFLDDATAPEWRLRSLKGSAITESRRRALRAETTLAPAQS